jgi:phosphatidylglycerophosphate synthase
MIILIKLILAHFIGDFLFQPKSWVEDKENKKVKSLKLYLHLLIHGFFILLFLWNFEYWLLTVMLVISHGIIDIIKLYAQKENNKTEWFFIDQILHILSIFVLWYFFLKPELNFEKWFENEIFWIYSVAILFITVVSGIIMRELMSYWSRELNESNDESLKQAGKYIGILERLFVFTFVVLGSWEGIGFLLAAKSVFRFGDLKESKDRKLTEYILIGTLLSFGIAIATGKIVLKLIEI